MRASFLKDALTPQPDDAPLLQRLAIWGVGLAIAAAGGAVAWAIGTPLPWLLGALVATAIAMAAGLRVGGRPLHLPQTARLTFITVIGVAIGGTARPEMLAEIPDWWRSLLAVGVFVLLAQVMNYQIFRRIAGYDRPTAYYCATPGGLIESVQLGEEAGGNPALLTVQHFSRIAITVSLVPLIYWAMRGEVVGSAAGVSLEATGDAMGAADVAVMVACAVLGGWGGRQIGLPAAIITGPILLSMLAHITGLTTAQPPDWAIAVAQLVVGLGLALRFQGLNPRLLWQGLAYGFVTVAAMLLLATGISWAVALTGEHPFQVLLMCYAPGGVVEMGLIALSLGVSPVMVTMHHILRIGFTVVAIPLAAKRLLPAEP